MILVIDNYDSFTYNLVQYLGELGQQVVVYRNDQINLLQIEQLRPDHILISPGPRTPDEAGISLQLVEHFKGRIPMLGVCLGHQVIGQAFGGRIVPAKQLVLGKTSTIEHDGKTLFEGLNNPLHATRYHSLVLEKETIPDCLEMSAQTPAGELMGVRHKTYAIEGVQFHPESIISEFGRDLLRNFLRTKEPVVGGSSFDS